MNDIKCSVIIPTYNRAHYIEKALVSVLAQTLMPIEILVMDDGSFDNTPYVLDRYASQYSNIRLFRHELNQGISKSRNVLLDHSTAEYVYMLDSDNYILNDSILQTMYDMATSAHSDMLFSNRRIRYEGPAGLLHYDENAIERGLFNREMEHQNLETMPTLIQATSSCNFFYSNNFLKTNGIRFDDRLKRWEDIPFYVGALLKASRVSIWPESSRIRRRHAGSIMKQYFGYENYEHRSEEDVAMCLRATRLIEDRFRESLDNRPGLAEAHRRMQKIIISTFGLLALGNLVATTWGRSTAAAPYRHQMCAIARDIKLEQGDFAFDNYGCPLASEAVKRNYNYYRLLQNGRFEEAYNILNPVHDR